MLRAYSNMPADEFIAQLRTYVIAMGSGPRVVDCVDNLKGVNDEDDEHSTELYAAEEKGEKSGQDSMKQEVINVVTRWIEDQPNHDEISKPAEAILKLLENIEV